MRSVSLLVLCGLFALMLAACGGSDSETSPTSTPGSSGSTATQTSPPDTPSATEPAAAPTATEQTTSPTEQEPSLPDAEPFQGRADVDDETGDAESSSQSSSEPLAGVDITRVTVEGDGDALVVTFEAATPFAEPVPSQQYVSWDVNIILDGILGYELRIYRSANATELSIWDYDSMTRVTVDGQTEIDGASMTASFPADMMPRVEGAFYWFAMVTCNDLANSVDWEDTIPSTASIFSTRMDGFAIFPNQN